MNDRLVYTSVASFISGVLLHSFVFVSLSIAYILLFIGCTIVLYLALIGKATSGEVIRKPRFIFLAALALALFSAGLLRYHYFSVDRGDPKLMAAAGQGIVAEGIVVEEPEIRDQDIRIVVALDSFVFGVDKDQQETEGATTSISRTKILASIGSYSRIKYGDKILLSGVLKLPEKFETDNGREFDYVSFLAKNKIFFVMKRAKFAVVSPHAGNKVKELLLSTKAAFLEKISRVIVAPESGLMSGLLVSGKQSLPSSTLEEFKRVGIVHVVALSGYNVSIVAESLGRLLLFLPSTIGLVVGAMGIVSFTVMAGAGSTVVRASIMAILVIASKLLGRTYNVARALLVAGVSMIALNPMILIFDPSFQLSFLSTIGIMYVSPLVSKWVVFVPQAFKLRETVIATLATQLFVLPYLLWSSGQLSIVALPVNLLVLFFVPFTMLMGFLTGALSFAASWLALPTAIISYLLLHYDLKIVSVFASLRYASVATPHFSLGLMMGCYVVYAFILIKFHRKNEATKSKKALVRT